MYLIESLVAIIFSGLMAFALFDMATGTMRTMNRATRDAQAYELIEQLTEQTRSYGYAHLNAFRGQTINLTLNRESGTAFENEAFQKRPALLDCVRRTWRQRNIANKFIGTVTYYVFDGPEPDTLNVAIDLHWIDLNTAQERSVGRVMIVINN